MYLAEFCKNIRRADSVALRQHSLKGKLTLFYLAAAVPEYELIPQTLPYKLGTDRSGQTVIAYPCPDEQEG